MKVYQIIGSVPGLVSRVLLGTLLLTAGTGCSPLIGDGCTYSSTDCPTGSYCDPSMPGGYCTKTPCHPTTEDYETDCPEESNCIVFSNSESYCMADCSSDGDCREDYKCLSIDGGPKFCGIPAS